MAHANIDERRAEVGRILGQRVALSWRMRSELGIRFGCSAHTIYADESFLRRPRGISVHTTPHMRARVRNRDIGTCQYCGTTDGELIVEHVLPAMMGGPARLFNLVLACGSCNALKGGSVWIPWNLDEITEGRLEWRDVIHRFARGRYGRQASS
jgi:hypothetical protein